MLGVEALHTRDVRHTHRLLVNHISAIRRIPIFSHTTCVLILESNLAFESQHLLHALEAAGVKKWVSLSEGQQGALGWLTVCTAPPPFPKKPSRTRPSPPRPTTPPPRADSAAVFACAQTHERKEALPVHGSNRGEGACHD